VKEISTCIYVEPRAKGRARYSVANGHVRAYTPVKTRNAEAEICIAIREHVMKLGSFDAGVPLVLDATFYILKPKSKSKKVLMPVTRPDVDNYVKTLLDALNKYVIPDDSQVVTLRVRKRYGQTPCIDLKIREEAE
jgi:Holliday junction resolvase RusA-like endonuclease